MSKHLYTVGAVVSLEADGHLISATARYVVEAQMPPLGTSLQYRIKSEAEGFRRVVVEHAISIVGADPIPPSPPISLPHSGQED